MSMSKELLRQYTLQERVRLHQLVASGMTEADAVNVVFPTGDARGNRINSNRWAKLRTWAEKIFGLYRKRIYRSPVLRCRLE
jgi:hypothetical protein